MDALKKQVGGTHYKKGYQPISLICKLQMNFVQGNILKYPSRFADKNGKEDLQKAVHYCQLGCELNPLNVAVFSRREALKYVQKNSLPIDFVEFIEEICNQNWLFCSSYILRLSEAAYKDSKL